MRVRVIAAAVAALSAAPVYAQSTDVDRSTDVDPPDGDVHGFARDVQTDTRITVAGPHVTDGRTAMTDGLVVINRTPDDGLAIGQRYLAQRLRTDPKRFPEGEGYGDLRVSGWVTIRAIDEFNALARNRCGMRLDRNRRLARAVCRNAAADLGHRAGLSGLQRPRQRPVRDRQPRAVRRRAMCSRSIAARRTASPPATATRSTATSTTTCRWSTWVMRSS